MTKAEPLADVIARVERAAGGRGSFVTILDDTDLDRLLAVAKAALEWRRSSGYLPSMLTDLIAAIDGTTEPQP